jgi:hypothetical protein
MSNLPNSILLRLTNLCQRRLLPPGPNLKDRAMIHERDKNSATRYLPHAWRKLHGVVFNILTTTSYTDATE